MTDFSDLINTSQGFLTELSKNNEKPWWQAHKPRYDADLKAPALALLDQVEAELSQTYGFAFKPKLYRPHRDVRFSKDKTPYHTHLHMLWSLQPAGGLFFGISPDYVTLGGGIMAFDKPVIDAWRKALDTSFGDDITTALGSAAAKGYEPREPELKRVPAPYPQDHPQGENMRRKGLAIWREVPEAEWGDPSGALTQARKDLSPILDLLGRVA